VLRQSRIRALQLTGDIDISVRNDFYAALESLADADLAVIDVGEIGYFDLTLINGLIGLKERMAATDATKVVRLLGSSEFMRRILEIADVSPMFDLPVDGREHNAYWIGA
jgi:hypothetical protein